MGSLRGAPDQHGHFLEGGNQRDLHSAITLAGFKGAGDPTGVSCIQSQSHTHWTDHSNPNPHEHWKGQELGGGRQLWRSFQGGKVLSQSSWGEGDQEAGKEPLVKSVQAPQVPEQDEDRARSAAGR